jgi:chorismate synthase
MSANSFGEIFKITSFGESHGAALGVVIDGCPAGVHFDLKLLQSCLNRRKPGTSTSVSQRQEPDQFEVLSGIFEQKTLGTPIAIMTRNLDARSEDYDKISKQSRHGHADEAWKSKFKHSDPRGGGRSSGRETVARVMAGAVAEMFIQATKSELKVLGFSTQIGEFKLSEQEALQAKKLSRAEVDQFAARFPSLANSEVVRESLEKARLQGQSYGGVAEFVIQNAPKNLGQPVFHKLKSDLAVAVMSLGATSAFEIGDGVHASQALGTEFHNLSQSAQYGGLRGGISTGEDIVIRAHFKPTSSILDVAKQGRHDPCIVTRAIPVIEAMIWLVLADHILWARKDLV